MIPGIGQASSGFVASRPAEPTAAPSEDGPGFADLVHPNGKASNTEKRASRDDICGRPQGARHAASMRDTDRSDDGAETASSMRRTTRFALETAPDDADGIENDAKQRADGAKNAADATSPTGKLPLLIALHDMRQFVPAAQNRAVRTAGGDASDHPALAKDARPTIHGSHSEPACGSVPVGPNEAPSTAISPVGGAAQADLRAVGGAQNAADGTDFKAFIQPTMPEGGDRTPPSIALKQSLAAKRVGIVAEQSFPAPIAAPISPTASALSTAIATEIASPAAISAPASGAQPTVPVAVSTHVLKIELHPAELGIVTASLRLSGEQLSIELKPENHEAHRRLSADTDAIIKSLRSLGFDVDQVTILQPSIAPAAAGADAGGSATASPSREQPSFQPGHSSAGGGGPGGQQAGRNRNDDLPETVRTAPVLRPAAGSDLII